MIGVCIKYFHENYGGMLQAYATVSMIEDRGLDYELVQYEKKHSIPGIIKSVPRLLNGVLLNDKYEEFLKRRGLKKHPEIMRLDEIRIKAFHDFQEHHFTRLSPVFSGYDNLRIGAQRYSAVVTGSDQLWSPAGLPTNYYNLKFVPDNIRKISIASSFGVKNIPWYQKRRTAEFLRRIEYISMRETRGSEIVKELTGRVVPTILDPVFIYDKEGWERLIPNEKVLDEPYVFSYFLGRNPEHRKAVKSLADALHCKIIALRHLDQYVDDDENFGDIALYDVGPDKFLNLIRWAKFVCTDSFHGSCFSIIHEKPFITFNRYDDSSNHSKNSRIDTLCNSLNLQERRYSGRDHIENQMVANIDYPAVKIRLNQLMAETQEYLDDAFDGIN